MVKLDKAPNALVVKAQRGLSPVDAWSAEILMKASVGEEFELLPTTKRTNRSLRLYWLILKRVVDATDLYPDTRHLHHALKLACGYTFEFYDMETGQMRKEVDSVAFDAMSKDEFNEYTKRAYDKLSELMGFSVTAFLEQ